MTLRDKRDELAASDADTYEVAALADALRETGVLQQTVESAARTCIEAYLDTHDTDVDEAAIDTLAAWTAKKSQTGPFLLRNQVVTNEQAGLQAGDIIHMESARDPENVIDYRIVTADSDATSVEATRINSPDDRPKRATTDFGAGLVEFCDRFAIERTEDAEAQAAAAGAGGDD